MSRTASPSTGRNSRSSVGKGVTARLVPIRRDGRAVSLTYGASRLSSRGRRNGGAARTATMTPAGSVAPRLAPTADGAHRSTRCSLGSRAIRSMMR